MDITDKRTGPDTQQGGDRYGPGKEEKPRHPAVAHIMQFFEYGHLPKRLQEVSRPFCKLAVDMADLYPQNPETTVALRKLLEAKDAAVRAHLPTLS